MFLWVLIIALVAALVVTVGIGANDLANSFGAAYGAKVLTVKQIVIIAAFCEFGGAVLLGSEVAKTIGDGISKNSVFANEPYVFMYGMFAALLATAFWLLLATFKKLPVSTTHSIVGGVVGMALVYGGGGAVIWAESKSSMPFVKGIVPIFISWFTSPLMTTGFCALSYWLLRKFVLRKHTSAVRAAIAFGTITFVTFFIDVYFVLTKGMKARIKWEDGRCAWVSFIVAAVAGAAGAAITPYLMTSTTEGPTEPTSMDSPQESTTIDAIRSGSDEARAERTQEGEMVSVRDDDARLFPSNPPTATQLRTVPSTIYSANAGDTPMTPTTPEGPPDHVTCEVAHSPSQITSEGPFARGIRTSSSGGEQLAAAPAPSQKKKRLEIENFDPKYERCFKYLQIFTSIVVSFAHGANDVSNSVGAAAMVYEIYKNASIPDSAKVPIWFLALGGAGIVTGLALFGVKIMKVLGEEMVVLSPSRGFAAQFATALVVTISSAAGLPVSTTHCITGAIVGIGLLEGKKGAVEWNVVGRTAVGWIVTLLVTGVISALCFAQAVYAPCAE